MEDSDYQSAILELSQNNNSNHTTGLLINKLVTGE